MGNGTGFDKSANCHYENLALILTAVLPQVDQTVIDIHNHIIPAIDDGPKTLEQSLALLKLAESDGIRRLVCTPHMHPGRYDNDSTTITPAFTELAQQAQKAGIGIELAMAAEVRFSDELIVQLQQKRIPMIGQWQGDDCLLLELPHQHIPVGIKIMLDWLTRQQVRVVLAHPERNRELMAYPERIFPMLERGALLQVTAGAVTGAFGEPAQKTARWLLDRELVSFIASDAHHEQRRPVAMGTAAQVLEQWYGQSVREQLTQANPDQLTATLFGVSTDL